MWILLSGYKMASSEEVNAVSGTEVDDGFAEGKIFEPHMRKCTIEFVSACKSAQSD